MIVERDRNLRGVGTGPASGVVVSFPEGTAGTVNTTGGTSVTGVSGIGVTVTIGSETAPVPPGNSTVIQGGAATTRSPARLETT